MTWHFCIDSAEKIALWRCGGSMDVGKGWGFGIGDFDGDGWSNGDGYFPGFGYGYGYGSPAGNNTHLNELIERGDGSSSQVWS